MAAAGCTPARVNSAGDADAPPQGRLIDAHCHLFNITDLPAARFTQRVLLRDYAHPGTERPEEVILGRALREIQEILSKGVVTADAEARPPSALFAAPLSSFPLSTADERALREQERRAEAARRQAAFEAAAARCEPSRGPSPSLRSISGWFHSLRSSRTAMTRELTAAHAASGYQARLLCPALVDYSNWLRQELCSPLPDQVRMAGVLAQNMSLPPVHGYVPFDPLRRALIRNRFPVVDGTWDPLDLVRTALVDEGFLGVKVYPPMGFKASGNGATPQSYPPHVEQAFEGADRVGRELDASLDELWRLCTELDAPIMAHAANSNAAGFDYGRRADPAYWLPVVEAHPRLRVMLGHFGRFGTYSAGHLPDARCTGGPPFEATWEAAIGRFVRQHPEGGLFADISYLSEIFHRRDRARVRDSMRQYLSLDPDARHLVFGSDWVMLGIEKDYPKGGGYPHRVATFLAECGLSDSAIDGVMYGNARRFLGLAADGGARRRLLDFYARCRLPAERLPI